MGLFEDIAGLVEGGAYETTHNLPDEDTIPVQLATGGLESLDDVRSLLPEVLDHDEVDIELVSGQVVSLYGVAAEQTWVTLLDDPNAGLWVHAFKYENADDYTYGSALQTPAVELRV